MVLHTIQERACVNFIMTAYMHSLVPAFFLSFIHASQTSGCYDCDIHAVRPAAVTVEARPWWDHEPLDCRLWFCESVTLKRLTDWLTGLWLSVTGSSDSYSSVSCQSKSQIWIWIWPHESPLTTHQSSGSCYPSSLLEWGVDGSMRRAMNERMGQEVCASCTTALPQGREKTNRQTDNSTAVRKRRRERGEKQRERGGSQWKGLISFYLVL